jgi:hypothetical protein
MVLNYTGKGKETGRPGNESFLVKRQQPVDAKTATGGAGVNRIVVWNSRIFSAKTRG